MYLLYSNHNTGYRNNPRPHPRAKKVCRGHSFGVIHQTLEKEWEVRQGFHVREEKKKKS